MQIAVVNDELKEVYSKISEYELLGITEVSSKEKRVFYSDGIVVFHKNYRDIGFSKTFADTVVPECFVDKIITDDDVITINCGQVQYYVYLIKHKTHCIDTTLLPETIHIDTLINGLYFDANKISVKHNTIITPIDLKKLGKLSLKQKTAIKRIINNELGGSQNKFQCCRVPAFSVEFHNDEYTICGHVCDYAENQYLNKVVLYKSNEDFNNVNPYKTYVEYVNNFRK